MKAEISLGPMPGDTSIVVDGKELKNCVGACRVTTVDGAVTLIQSDGTYPNLELQLVLESAVVSAEGDLVINAEPVSDEVGLAIYQSLKERYEGTTEPLDLPTPKPANS